MWVLRSPLALMIAGPFADAFGIQTWFLVTGISCTLMGMLDFLSTDVMQMKGRTTENTRPGLKASGKEGCEVS
jgi:hypothetical protein